MIQAAKTTAHVLLLAAVCLPALANIPRTPLVAEKPHQGVSDFALASHRAESVVNAVSAQRLPGCLYDSCVKPCSSGKERDGETGLDYFGARYMSASQGRFTSPDRPFYDQWEREPQTWNLYSYGRNNPLKFNDPTGTASYDANGSWVGDFDGEKSCAFSSGGNSQCLFWHQKSSSWESSRPQHDANPVGMAWGFSKDFFGNGFVATYNALAWASDQVDGRWNYTSPRLDYFKPNTQADQRGMLVSMAASLIFLKPGRVPKGLGNVHGGQVTATEALAAAEKWLGKGYKEIAPGVFRSADGGRLFRMTDADILFQGSGGPHVHFESIGADGRTIVENSHVYLKDK